MPSDQRLLQASYKMHAQQPPSSIRTWLTFYRKGFKKSRIFAAKHAITRARPITTYFASHSESSQNHHLTVHLTSSPAQSRKKLFPCSKPTGRLQSYFCTTQRSTTLKVPTDDSASVTEQIPPDPTPKITLTPITKFFFPR